MKRILCFIVVLLFFVFALCGCSAQPSSELSVILTEINTQFGFENLKILSSVDELNRYYLIEPEDVVSFASQVSLDATDATEIIFVEAVDKDSASEISTLLDNYYRTRLDMANSYDAEYEKLLSKCSVKQNGNFVSLIICENVEEAEMLYNSYFE